MEKIQSLFLLLKSAIGISPLYNVETNVYSNAFLSELFDLAKRHDVAHLVAYALQENGLDVDENIGNIVLAAICRYERMHYEYVRLCGALEEARIPFMPLKGAVLRGYYPAPWMRTSCDIDILVRDSDVDNAAQIIADKLGYVNEGRGSHDITLKSPSGVHIELHFELVEKTVSDTSFDVLISTWDNASVATGWNYRYEMTDEMFYFYHVAHMAKHFSHGGCGVRPFIDLYILDNIAGYDKEKRDAVLERGELLKFAEAARKLSLVWLENAEHNEITQQLEDFILNGGVYGTAMNRIAVQQQQKGGKFKYLISKTFLPYDVIKFHYPVLQKHKWLTPIMQVRRWFKLVFCGHAGRVIKEVKYGSSIELEQAEKTKKLLESIGL